jgi:hypothetical protein
MKCLLAGVAAVAILSATPSAWADISKVPEHCVTISEAYALDAKHRKGIRPTEAQVDVLFGVHGKKDLGRSTHEKVVKVYPACTDDSIVDGFFRVAFWRKTMRALGAAYMYLVVAAS